MREQFIFIPQKETPVSYLTRMSPILGALRNDGISVADPVLVHSISHEERKEIENEMCRAFEKTVRTETRRIIRLTPGDLTDYEDDYCIELNIAVFRDVHKFNNPVYLQNGQTYSIDAFVRSRTAGVTKKIMGIKRERKEYEMKRESHVKKIIQALNKEKSSSSYDLIEVWENQHLAKDSMVLSLNQVRDVLAAMEDPAYFEDIMEDMAVYKGKEMETVDQQDVVDDFIKDFSGYKEYEWYIYLQSLRLRLDETTNKEIACDKKLIDLCKEAPEVKDKIIYERIVIERPKSGIAPNSEYDEYVSTTYIETTYRKIDRHFKSAVRKKNLDESDILAIIRYLINM